MYTVMVAWEREMFKELDFRNEGANLEAVRRRRRRRSSRTRRHPSSLIRQVGANVYAAQIDAIVPAPRLATRRVLVMDYIDGFKITDEASLAAHQVSVTREWDHLPETAGGEHLSYVWHRWTATR